MNRDNNPVVLFDGICNFCNEAVQFVIRHDKKEQVLFAALQSDSGQQLLNDYHLPTTDFDSFIFIYDGKVYKKSSAAIKLCTYFGGYWKIAKLFFIIPSRLRDMIYDIIAKNRYKWFGIKQQCMLPSASVRKRFL
ncbi:thiol-disulfide oxidoreductase DCC family protein [Metabacillus malikii]|uniref:DCC family thiol-disulfide oxidoreductase YuxK n=1 Tax=Metabacillus malikii TaxID=1504265 RepID=A0ABT9ZD69_9BACI|nr:thiol-disulfide oxidoreductase DCC family protein [Metabacillus malikii]MDQ0229792.1 putative DCC family thiol-disulfide oxidoreductase YuxK [Metabacillus malikii]